MIQHTGNNKWGGSIFIASHGFGTINNSGTILNKGKAQAAIFIDTAYGFSDSKGTLLSNSTNGVILSETQGISLGLKASLQTLDNKGLIQAKSDALVTFDGGSINNIVNSGTILSIGSSAIKLNTGNATIISNDKNGIIQGKKDGVAVTGNATIKTFDNKGTVISQDNAAVSVSGTLETLQNQGMLSGSEGIWISKSMYLLDNQKDANIIGNNSHAIQIASGSLGTIQNKGTILSQNKAGIYANGNINSHIQVDGGLIAGVDIGIHNKGTIGVNNSNNSVNNGNVIDLQNGATVAALNNDGKNLYSNSNSTAILNGGLIKGNINLDGGSKIIGAIYNKNTIAGNIALNDKSYITSINNEKTIQGSVDLKEKSHIDSIINSGTIVGGIKLDDSTIGSIENSTSLDLTLKDNSEVGILNNSGTMTIDQDNTSNINSVVNIGTISGTITNNSNMISVVNKNSIDNIVNKISLTKDENKAISQIINQGEQASIKTIENGSQSSIGVIMNTGSISNINNEGSITTAIGNGGFIDTIENKTNANIAHIKNDNIIKSISNQGTIDKFNNYFNGIIESGINNSGVMNIENYGTINNGITNSGTLTLNNGHVVSKPGGAEWEGGTITKSNDGYHIKNENGGKISIDGWYFDALEYTQSNEQRLENSIIIGGANLGGISADKIYVNTSKLQLNTIYDANTFFANEKGESKGDKTNNGTGVDGNNIYSLSGIYDFMGLGNGRYIANVNLSELSGKTLAKSMVYSSRLRNINISNILRDVTSKNFQTDFSQVLDMELSKKGEAYGNDADLLAELEDIFIPNKNVHAKNHSFLIPYYNHSSIKIGKSVGQLSANTTGLIGGSQRELPNDYGIIGFYLGYEDASKEQATQRLKFDDKTYYGGLTYYGILARDGINQYYISASTRLDYTKTDIEKSYKNIPTTIDSDTKTYGYGVDVKVGANYYNTLDIARISPEFGLSYYGMSNKNFKLIHIDGLKEHYLAEQFNFIDASAALKWYKPWSDKIRSNVTIGAIVNLYNDAKGSLLLGQNRLSSEIETSKYYGFGQLGLSYAIADNADLSLNYAGAFTFDNTTSHTMFLKLGLWW
ncbi:hypothetical protein [Campylobacter lari]|uniref:hypothetical protein n=1 Tax=Campylobacter lari TaxID=201 RepID=UPI000E1375A6|nr:hypothetical protein [Campylobacter lari]SUX06140.1 autotransporter beta-domain-containing protein [Campylobacter lari]